VFSGVTTMVADTLMLRGQAVLGGPARPTIKYIVGKNWVYKSPMLDWWYYAQYIILYMTFYTFPDIYSAAAGLLHYKL